MQRLDRSGRQLLRVVTSRQIATNEEREAAVLARPVLSTPMLMSGGIFQSAEERGRRRGNRNDHVCFSRFEWRQKAIRYPKDTSNARVQVICSQPSRCLQQKRITLTLTTAT